MDKISILLHEYNTLRNEIIQRNTMMFQSIGIYATVLIGMVVLISQTGLNWILGALIGVSTFVFAGALTWLDYDVAKAARRVRELEREINKRAGEPLLQWESKSGLGGPLGKKLIRESPSRVSKARLASRKTRSSFE